MFTQTVEEMKMLAAINRVPRLVPWSKSKQCLLLDNVPPEKMRAVWLGQWFPVEFGCNAMKFGVSKKKSLSSQVLVNGGCEPLILPDQPSIQIEDQIIVIYSVDFKEGMQIISQACEGRFVSSWYHHNWPEESPFFFSEDEVRIAYG